MNKAKLAFFSQSELFEIFSDCSDWLDKSRPSQKLLLFCSYKQATVYKSYVTIWLNPLPHVTVLGTV